MPPLCFLSASSLRPRRSSFFVLTLVQVQLVGCDVCHALDGAEEAALGRGSSCAHEQELVDDIAACLLIFRQSHAASLPSHVPFSSAPVFAFRVPADDTRGRRFCRPLPADTSGIMRNSCRSSRGMNRWASEKGVVVALTCRCLMPSPDVSHHICLYQCII